MIKRLIFDIDGTLIRGVNFKSAVAETLKRYDLASKENVEKFIKAIGGYEKLHNNYNAKDYLSYFGVQLGTTLEEDFLREFFSHLRFVVPEDSEEVRDTIDYLSKRYELVLLSNYFEESQRNRLAQMGINEYFQEYYGEKIIKPNREAYLSAKGIYLPEECIIIGDDEELDINVPARMGFHTIQVVKEKQKEGTIEDIKVLKKIL